LQTGDIQSLCLLASEAGLQQNVLRALFAVQAGSNFFYRTPLMFIYAPALYMLKFFAVTALFSLSIAYAAQPHCPGKPHCTKNGFRNTTPYEQPDFFDFLKWRWNRMFKKIPPPGTYHFPLAQNDPAFLKANRDKTALTWIGHATVLLQLKGKNILTDPHFSPRASPVQWAGPERVVAPGLSLEDLPPIDWVVISHDHYDSLDKPTIKNLYRREGGKQTLFFVPLGLKAWFRDLGISRVVEMDWWSRHEENGLKIIAVPVQHWSKRSPFSRNTSLWAGWVIHADDFRFFFSGDTGYAPIFKEIGQKLGPFDLSAIPIGAYEPRWFMRYHHVTPEEALQIHLDLRSKKSVAIHWGTFMLTDEPLDEPPKRLVKALEEKNLSKDDFVVLEHGETIFLN
jgi:N-acyl-phosphatidylethanolamine-hydrolysing phospholipase D